MSQPTDIQNLALLRKPPWMPSQLIASSPAPGSSSPPGISSRQSSALHFSSVGPCALNAGSGLVHWAQRSDIHPACVFAGDAGAFHPQGAMLEEGPRIVFLMRLAIAGPSVQ